MSIRINTLEEGALMGRIEDLGRQVAYAKEWLDYVLVHSPGEVNVARKRHRRLFMAHYHAMMATL